MFKNTTSFTFTRTATPVSNSLYLTLNKYCNGPDEDDDVVHCRCFVLCDDEDCVLLSVMKCLTHSTINTQSTEACADDANKWAGFTTACAATKILKNFIDNILLSE